MKKSHILLHNLTIFREISCQLRSISFSELHSLANAKFNYNIYPMFYLWNFYHKYMYNL